MMMCVAARHECQELCGLSTSRFWNRHAFYNNHAPSRRLPASLMNGSGAGALEGASHGLMQVGEYCIKRLQSIAWMLAALRTFFVLCLLRYCLGR